MRDATRSGNNSDEKKLFLSSGGFTFLTERMIFYLRLSFVNGKRDRLSFYGNQHLKQDSAETFPADIRLKSPGIICVVTPLSNITFDSMLRAVRRQFRARVLALGLLVVMLGIVLLSYTKGGVVHILLRWDINNEQKTSLVQQYFLSWGYLAPLAYLGAVIIEVIIAPIPGMMLYAPGGMIFGGFVGGSMTLLGNVLGAGICHRITRILGKSFVESHLAGGSLGKYEPLLEKQGIWIIFFLRLIPFTSSDFVSYAAGLTSIPTWKVMLGTFLGMLPLCYLQAYLAEEIFKAFPSLILPVFIVCIIYGFYVIWIVKKLSNPESKNVR